MSILDDLLNGIDNLDKPVLFNKHKRPAPDSSKNPPTKKLNTQSSSIPSDLSKKITQTTTAPVKSSTLYKSLSLQKYASKPSPSDPDLQKQPSQQTSKAYTSQSDEKRPSVTKAAVKSQPVKQFVPKQSPNLPVSPYFAALSAMLSKDSDEESESSIDFNREVITTVSACRRAIKEMKKSKIVAIDTEAVEMSRHGQLCLVQAATSNLKSYLFDVVEGGDALFTQGGLKWLLETPTIIKIIHDCRGDSDLLFHKHQVRLSNVFDTQIGYAIMSRLELKPTPLPVSLNTVIRRFGNGATLDLKDLIKEEMTNDPSFWARRPMSENMLNYARGDVIHLPRVHEQMDAFFDTQSRKRVFDLSQKYVEQFRDLSDRPRETNWRDGGEKDEKPKERYVPKYGFEDWDREVSFMLLLPPKGSRRLT